MLGRHTLSPISRLLIYINLNFRRNVFSFACYNFQFCSGGCPLWDLDKHLHLEKLQDIHFQLWALICPNKDQNSSSSHPLCPYESLRVGHFQIQVELMTQIQLGSGAEYKDGSSIDLRMDWICFLSVLNKCFLAIDRSINRWA